MKAAAAPDIRAVVNQYLRRSVFSISTFNQYFLSVLSISTTCCGRHRPVPAKRLCPYTTLKERVMGRSAGAVDRRENGCSLRRGFCGLLQEPAYILMRGVRPAFSKMLTTISYLFHPCFLRRAFLCFAAAKIRNAGRACRRTARKANCHGGIFLNPAITHSKKGEK